MLPRPKLAALAVVLLTASCTAATQPFGRPGSAVVPDDPWFSEQAELYHEGGSVVLRRGSARATADTLEVSEGVTLDAPAAWRITTGDQRVVVALMDDGFYYAHPDVRDNIWVNPGESGTAAGGLDRATNGVDDDGNGYVDDVMGWDFAFDDADPDHYAFDGMDRSRIQPYWHSIPALGIIGARGNNGIGVTGVNWRVSLMLLKIGAQGILRDDVDSLRVDRAAAAIRYAVENGARVINWSGFVNDTRPEQLAKLRDAINVAESAGVLLVVGAGNDGERLDDPAARCTYPACFDHGNLVRVAELDWNGELVRYEMGGGRMAGSNWGPGRVEIAALGRGFTTDLRGGAPVYGRHGGTSNAGPVVAGVAGLILAVRPDLRAAELREILIRSARPLPALAGKVTSGGVVNAHRAVQLALAYPSVAGATAHPTSAAGTIARGAARTAPHTPTTAGHTAATATHAATAAALDTTRYAVSFETAAASRFGVTMRLNAPAGRLELHFPGWTPGGFQSNWARNVRGMRFEDDDGRVVRHDRTGSHTWRVELAAAGAITVRYEVVPDRSDELGMIANHLASDGAFFQGTTLFLYAPALRERPVALELDIPIGWRVATPLRSAGPATFVAADYDELALAPVQAGAFADWTVAVGGCDCAVRLVLDDPSMPVVDTAALHRIVSRVLEEERRVFGSAPFDTLLVLLHWRPDLEFGGGLARRAAIVLNVGIEWVPDLAASAAGTFAHELAHTWNHGSFHPRFYTRTDYTSYAGEPYLWLVEGWSTYLTYEVFARLGWLDADRFLDILSGELATLEAAPARRWQSLADAGATALFDDTETLPAASGGTVTAFLLDLIIRRSSAGARTFDDVLRALYDDSRRPGYEGYERDDVIRALSAAAGHDLSALYAQLVESRDAPDYDAILAGTGIAVRHGVSGAQTGYRFEVIAPEGRALLEAIVGAD